MTRTQVILFDESIDELAKMLIAYVLNIPDDFPNKEKKVVVVVEFLEEVLDPSFDSIAVYLRVLDLMPKTMRRKLPYRIEEFISMYTRQIEEKLEDIGGIPMLYRPQSIVTEEKKILGADGNVLSIVL